MTDRADLQKLREANTTAQVEMDDAFEILQRAILAQERANRAFEKARGLYLTRRQVWGLAFAKFANASEAVQP